MHSNRLAQTRRRVGVAFVALGAASLFGALIPTTSAVADAPTNNACNGAFQGNPPGSLAKVTSPIAGSTVVAGQTVTVTIAWNTADWSGDTLDQIHDCVQVNGVGVDALDEEQKPTANDGSWSTSYLIPGDVAAGDEVCDRSSLSGNPSAQNPSTQKSNKVCFTVGDATTTSTVAPTTTSTVAAPTTTTVAPTTTTTVAPTTTTVAPTTTTVAPTTTTTAGETTTTTVGETTTTVPETTSSTVGETTSSTAPAAPTTTVTVLGIVIGNDTTSTSGAVDVLGVQLARTGANIKGLLLMAGLALLLGGLALIAGEKTDAFAGRS